MAICFPDTNIVIGRARRMDIRRHIAVKALDSYRQKDIKILKTVYEEARAVIAKKNARVIMAIEESKRLVATEYKIKECALGRSHAEDIIANAKERVDKDIASYFEDVAKSMKGMLDKNLNPFDHLGFVLEMATEKDYHSIDNIFLIRNPKDCLGCEDEIHFKMMDSLEALLKNENEFFEDYLNGMDRRIASETAIVVWVILKKQVDFVTDDNDFHLNFNAMLVKMASEIHGGSTMLKIVNV